MARETSEALRRRASDETASGEAQASAAAEDYLAACAAVGVTPNGGPHTADDLARRIAELRGEG